MCIRDSRRGVVLWVLERSGEAAVVPFYEKLSLCCGAQSVFSILRASGGEKQISDVYKRQMLFSGTRIPTSLRFLNILGRRFPVFSIKVNGPGRVRFISLNVLLSTLAYSLILLK